MAAVANGLALHSGVRPVVATFLVFSDYLRPSLRLAALMELPVIYVFTHDSVHLGEDGPTHQPVEHLDALRLIPNVHVHRPADARETVEAWRSALRRLEGPTVIALTRQALPVLDRADPADPVVVEPPASPDVVLVASGSEVSLCCESAELLQRDGVGARVVSVPRAEALRVAAEGERRRLFPEGVPKLFVEAGTGMVWERWRGPADGVLRIERFGASAPGATVAAELGLDPENVRRRVLGLLGRG